ncbi:MAG: tetratricopeptide repeat protein [Planctomycetota bacterium]
MRSGPWILLAFALAVVAGLLQLWSTRAGETPESLLHTASQRLEQVKPDFDRGLLELSRGIELAEQQLESDDPDVRARAKRIGSELLHERARTHHRLWNWPLAIRDARRAVEEFGADPEELLELACESALRGDDAKTALELSELLLSVAPDRADALAFRGEARLIRVRQSIERLRERLHDDRPATEAERAVPRIQRAVALGEDSELFEAALESVALAFRIPSTRQNALREVRQAAGWLRAARRDFVDSLGIEPTRLATEGIQEILFLAGYHKDAALFGRLLLDLPQVALPSPTLLRTVEAWIALEQPDRAIRLLKSVERVQPQILDFRLMDTDLFERWAVALYELKQYEPLHELARMFGERSRAAGGREEHLRFTALSHLFTALSQADRNPTWAMKTSEYYLAYDGPEPFPGARLAAYLTLARLARQAKNRTLENYAIGAATDSGGVTAPEDLREDLGRAWIDRASALAAAGDPVGEEDALAKAMSAWPPLAEEITERWTDAGERSIHARRRDYEARLEEYLATNSYVPEQQLGSYELVKLSRDALERGDVYGAKAFLIPAAARYPGLPPMLLQQALVAYRSGDMVLAADASLTLLETGAGTIRDVPTVVELPVDDLPGELAIRWFRAVPPAHALLAMLDRLPTQRKRELLLSSLLSQNSQTRLFGPPLARAAYLCVELGRWAECVHLLSHLTVEHPAFGELVGFAMLANMNAPDIPGVVRRLGALVAGIERADHLVASTLLPAVDQLHASGLPNFAISVLDRLMQTNPGNGDVILRDSIHALIDDDYDSARERLLQAGLFVDEPAVLMGRLAIASDRKDWDEVADAARALERTRVLETHYERALLLGLRGGTVQVHRALEHLDVEPAHNGTPNPLVPLARMALRSLAGEPRDSWATFEVAKIEGAPFVSEPGGPQDPRQVLAALLALRFEAWPIWTYDRLTKFPRAYRRSPWGTVQLAAAMSALGEIEKSLDLLSFFTGPGTVDFAPAWYLREQLTLKRALGDRTSAAYLNVRGFRVHAVGSDGIDEYERSLVGVYTAEWKGQHAEAIALLRELTRELPDDPELEFRLARNLFDAGRYGEAVHAFRRVLDRDDEQARATIPTALEALRLATDVSREIHPRARWTYLESLEVRFPDDPAIVRERARLQVEGPREEGEFGIARAWDLLDVFRLRTRQRSIDELRPGEAERWLQLFLRYDPVRAREFARAELHANPASPDARWMWAKVLSESGLIHRAIDELASSTAAVSHPPSLRLYARLLAELGSEPTRVQGLIDATRVAEGLRERDPELIYVRALSLLELETQRDSSMQALTTLWQRRSEIEAHVAPADIGLYLAQAYLRRGDDRDAILAGGILDDLLWREREPVRRDFLRAMAHLARHHAPRDLRDSFPPPPTELDVAERFARAER